MKDTKGFCAWLRVFAWLESLREASFGRAECAGGDHPDVCGDHSQPGGIFPAGARVWVCAAAVHPEYVCGWGVDCCSMRGDLRPVLFCAAVSERGGAAGGEHRGVGDL